MEAIINDKVKIVLITAHCNINKTKLDLEKLGYTDKFRKSDKDRKFYNSIMFIVSVDSSENICVKFFTNGKILVSGCKNLGTLNKTFEEIEKYLKFSLNADDVCVIGKTVDMMNANTNLGFEINQNMLTMLINKNSEKLDVRYASFIPNKFSGIVVKLLNGATLFIFRTGIVAIRGAKSQDQIMHSYELLRKILEMYDNALFSLSLSHLVEQPV